MPKSDRRSSSSSGAKAQRPRGVTKNKPKAKAEKAFAPAMAILEDITDVVFQTHERASKMAASMKYPEKVRATVQRMLDSMRNYEIHRLTQVCEEFAEAGEDGADVIDLGDSDSESEEEEEHSESDQDDPYVTDLFEASDAPKRGSAPEMRDGPLIGNEDLGGISIEEVDTSKQRRSAFRKANAVAKIVRKSGLGEEIDDGSYSPDKKGDEDVSLTDLDSDADSESEPEPGMDSGSDSDFGSHPSWPHKSKSKSKSKRADSAGYTVILSAECLNHKTNKEAVKTAPFHFKSEDAWDRYGGDGFDMLIEQFNDYLQAHGHKDWFVDDVIETDRTIKFEDAVDPVIVAN